MVLFFKWHNQVEKQRFTCRCSLFRLSEGICISSLSVDESMVKWIVNWLEDRKESTLVDSSVSDWKPVLSGMIQGSVLRPLLILLYINVPKFADDLQLYSKVNEQLKAKINMQINDEVIYIKNNFRFISSYKDLLQFCANTFHLVARSSCLMWKSLI